MAHQFLLSSITLPWCTIIYFTYRLVVAYFVPIATYQRANLFFLAVRKYLSFCICLFVVCYCVCYLCELALYEN